MVDEETCQMDVRCHTCGDIGEAGAIVTCPRCKEINEHMYCMRICCKEYLDDWYCNECELRAEDPRASSPTGDLPRKSKLENSGTVSRDATHSLKSRKPSNETRRVSFRWEKHVATGRTKYIPVNEAIKLSSGAPIAQSTKTFPPQRKTGVSSPGRSSIKPQPVSIKFSAYPDRSNSAFGPSQKLKPKRHDNVDIPWPQQQSKEHTEVQRSVNVIQAATTPIHEQIQKELSAEVRNPAERLSPPSLPSASHPVDISGISNSDKVNDSILLDVEPRTSSAANVNNSTLPRTINADNVNNSIVRQLEQRVSNAENLIGRILPNAESRTSSSGNMNGNLPRSVDPTSNVDSLNHSTPPLEASLSNPALQALWMGSFIIHNGSKHEAVNDRIQAHPPGRVRRKVYEFSKLMPKVLHFDLCPFRELWTSLFEEYRPDGKSIGLYFLPSDCQRSEDYFSLLVSMMKKDLALRKQIGDIELLLFASTCLSPDCQRWDDEYFLWGLFRRMKRDGTERALTFYARPSNSAHNDEDNNEPIDMEIDLIGNEIMGPIDIVVRDRKGSSKDSTATTFLHGNVDSLKRERLVDVKREPCVEYPPGFEQVHLPRGWNLPRLMENGGANGERDKRDGS